MPKPTYEPRSARLERTDKTLLDIAGINGVKTVSKWEEAIDQGKAFEMSATADGAFAMPAYHDMVMIANSGASATIDFEGFLINSNNYPVLIEFWESATWAGGDIGTPPAPVRRNRRIPSTSQTTIAMKAYYATPLVRTGGELLESLTFEAGVNGFTFATSGLSERWPLKANTDYTVRLRNSAATAASISARMLWSEETI